MVTEDYCSQEVYRLLKEKGFNGESHTSFDKDGYTIPVVYHQMAMKWLREVHGLHIEIGNGDLDYWYVVDDVINRDENHYPITKANYEGYKTNEEAVEAALKYCLENLI